VPDTRRVEHVGKAWWRERFPPSSGHNGEPIGRPVDVRMRNSTCGTGFGRAARSLPGGQLRVSGGGLQNMQLPIATPLDAAKVAIGTSARACRRLPWQRARSISCPTRNSFAHGTASLLFLAQHVGERLRQAIAEQVAIHFAIPIDTVTAAKPMSHKRPRAGRSDIALESSGTPEVSHRHAW